MTNVTASRRTIVKVCGLMRPEDLLLASECGADMVGIVFAASRRQVTPEAARILTDALAGAGGSALTVGVFVNELPARIEEIADQAGLDIVQLSGDESPEDVALCAEFRPIIKALRFPPGTTYDEAAAEISRYTSLGLGGRLQLLVDAYQVGSYGGSGAEADRSLASQLARNFPLILAGGLNPANVGAAIAEVGPFGVDVSSGVERDGSKQPELIRQFIRAARTGLVAANHASAGAQEA